MRKAHNRVDMAGKQYNSWLVIEPIPHAGKNSGGLSWKAKCLECGEIYAVKGANLRSGMSKRCVKCGCGHAHGLQKGQIRTKRTSTESAIHYLLIDLKKSAKKRSITWELSKDQVVQLIFSNCTYCGTAPNMFCSPLKHHDLSQKRTEGATITRNGIDRVDSAKGYVEGNCVTACEQCNKAKLDYSLQDFKAWVMRVAAHLGQ